MPVVGFLSSFGRHDRSNWVEAFRRGLQGGGLVDGRDVAIEHLREAMSESAYEACVARELTLRGLPFERQKALRVSYKGVALECGYRMDFVIRNELVVELKAVEAILPVHSAQLISYLRLTGIRVGLLVNFHAPTIAQGLRRLSLAPPNSQDSL